MCVALAVVYTAGTDSLFYSSAEWTLHDATGAQYGESFAGYGCLSDPSAILSLGTVNPGLWIVGSMVFEVPASTKHLYADWNPSMSLTGQSETWRLW